MPNSPSQQASKARDSWKPVKALMALCPESANVKGNQARTFLKANPNYKPTLLKSGGERGAIKMDIVEEFIKFCENPILFLNAENPIFTHPDRPPTWKGAIVDANTTTTRPSQGDPTRPPRAGAKEKRPYNRKEPIGGFWAVLTDLKKLQIEYDLNLEQLEDCLLILKEVEIVGGKNRTSLRHLQDK